MPQDFWCVIGCSWKNNITKRNGKVVDCGHRHKTQEGLQRCLKKMRAEKPGKCQTYRASHIVYMARTNADYVE